MRIPGTKKSNNQSEGKMIMWEGSESAGKWRKFKSQSPNQSSGCYKYTVSKF